MANFSFMVFFFLLVLLKTASMRRSRYWIPDTRNVGVLEPFVSSSSLPLATVSPLHYGTKPGNYETSKIYFPTSEGVSEVSERANE